MDRAVHGGDIYSAAQKTGRAENTLLDFSANINPLGLSAQVRERIVRAVDDVVHYPDPLCRELRAKIAQREGVDAAHVICGNGAADLIFRLVRAVKPKRVLLPVPAFLEYEQALQGSVGCRITRYELKAEKDFVLDEGFIDGISPQLDMVILCNPNNPTGLTISASILEKVLEHCRRWNITLLLDECFNDFLEHGEDLSLVRYCADFPRLFVLKAFTKFYAMPGIRLGFGLCTDEALLERMVDQEQSWSVSGPAQAAGMGALETPPAYMLNTKKLVQTERAYLSGALTELGFKVYPAQANYVFFQAKQYPLLHEELLERGIMIRNCAGYPGLAPGYYRIAVRTREENEVLIRTMREVVLS